MCGLWSHARTLRVEDMNFKDVNFSKRDYLEVVKPTYEYEKLQTTLRIEQSTREKLEAIKEVSGLSRGKIIDMLVALAPIKGSLPERIEYI